MPTILTDQTVDLLISDDGRILDFIPQGKATGPLGGLNFVKLTQAAYDAMPVKDDNVLYVIVG